jgi:hypothetical protein
MPAILVDLLAPVDLGDGRQATEGQQENVEEPSKERVDEVHEM